MVLPRDAASKRCTTQSAYLRMGEVKCVYIALAKPKCKNCCVDGASPDAKYMERMLLCVVDNVDETYMA